MTGPDEQPPLAVEPPPDLSPEPPRDERLAAARVRRQLRLVPRPLAYCRPDNDNGRRR